MQSTQSNYFPLVLLRALAEILFCYFRKGALDHIIKVLYKEVLSTP